MSIDQRRSDFDSWLLTSYGFEADGTPVRDLPPSFGSEDRVFDITAYERWVERMKTKYDTTIEMERLSDGSYGPIGSIPPGPTNLLPAPAEPPIGSPARAVEEGDVTGDSRPES